VINRRNNRAPVPMARLSALVNHRRFIVPLRTHKGASAVVARANPVTRSPLGPRVADRKFAIARARPCLSESKCLSRWASARRLCRIGTRESTNTAAANYRCSWHSARPRVPFVQTEGYFRRVLARARVRGARLLSRAATVEISMRSNNAAILRVSGTRGTPEPVSFFSTLHIYSYQHSYFLPYRPSERLPKCVGAVVKLSSVASGNHENAISIGRSLRSDLSPAAHSCDTDNAGTGAAPRSQASAGHVNL